MISAAISVRGCFIQNLTHRLAFHLVNSPFVNAPVIMRAAYTYQVVAQHTMRSTCLILTKRVKG
jgi:hypothetical protein